MSSDADSATSYSSADKRTDEPIDAPTGPPAGFLWRFSTGVISTASGAVTGAVGLGVGAVGYGVGGVKWVAGKTVDVGSAVVHKTADAGSAVTSRLPLPSVRVPFITQKKDKKE